MENYFLIWLLIIIIGTLLFYIIFKNIIKTVVTFLFIVFLFVTITITLTYSDVQELKREIAQKEIVFVVHDEYKLVWSGVRSMNNNEINYKELQISTAEQERLLSKKEYEAFLEDGNYYKVLIISKELFEPLSEEISFESTEYREATETAKITKAELIAILENNDIAFEQRAMAYNILIGAVLNEKGYPYLLKAYKAEDIDIYPKTIFFKLISLVPVFSSE